jgi:hypothetical protein
VCWECNGTLGDEIDRKIARDSIEAVDRVRTGLKKPSAYKTEGKRSTSRVEFDEDGPLQGAYGYHVPDPNGGQSLAVAPLPQIGFARTESGPFEWFLIDDLPTKDEMIERGYERGTDAFIRTWGLPISTAQDELEKKGFKRGTVQEETQPPRGRVHVEIVTKISDPEFRAVSKIAFNYLAFIGGSDFVLMPQFNEIRRFIRYGAKLPWASVRPGPNPWLITRHDGRALVGHYVLVKGDNGIIDAQVCLFTRICYTIRLAAGGFLMPVTINAGHLFDIDGRQTVTLAAAKLPPFAPAG